MPEQHRSALERLHSDVGRWEALKRVVENRNAGHKCYLAVRAHEPRRSFMRVKQLEWIMRDENLSPAQRRSKLLQVCQRELEKARMDLAKRQAREVDGRVRQGNSPAGVSVALSVRVTSWLVPGEPQVGASLRVVRTGSQRRDGTCPGCVRVALRTEATSAVRVQLRVQRAVQPRTSAGSVDRNALPLPAPAAPRLTASSDAWLAEWPRLLMALEASAWDCAERLFPQDRGSRNLLLARLQELCSWAVPGSTVLLFGSTACELHAHGADLDLTLIPGPRPRSYPEQQALVRHLAEAFRQFQPGELARIEAVDRARVPILRLRDASSGLQCDLSIGNDVGVHKTRLLHAYVRLDHRVRPLCLIVKQWAKRRGLVYRAVQHAGGVSFRGALNSYAWVLLVIHYLQNGPSPPVLPWLHPHTLLCDGPPPPAPNTQCLAELLLGFFAYFAEVRLPAPPMSIATASYTARNLPRPGCSLPTGFCILDPVSPGEDLGRQLTPETMTALRRHLAQASRQLLSGTPLARVAEMAQRYPTLCVPRRASLSRGVPR